MKTSPRMQALLSCGIALAATLGLATAQVADGNKAQPAAAEAVVKPLPASDLSNPGAAYKTLLHAFRVRDVAAIRAVMTAADENKINSYIDQWLVVYAMSDLRKALTDRQIEANNLPDLQASACDEQLARASEAVIAVEGETATLKLENNMLVGFGKQLMTFRKVGDAWKWDVGVLERGNKESRISKNSAALVGFTQEIIAEVKQGKYQTEREVMKAWEAKADILRTAE